MGKRNASSSCGQSGKRPPPTRRAPKGRAKWKAPNRRSTATASTGASPNNSGDSNNNSHSNLSNSNSNDICNTLTTPEKHWQNLNDGQKKLLSKLEESGFSPLRHNEVPTLESIQERLKRDFPDVKNWPKPERKLALFLYSREWLPKEGKLDKRSKMVRDLIFNNCEVDGASARLRNVASTKSTVDKRRLEPCQGVQQFNDAQSTQLYQKWTPPSDPRKKRWEHYMMTVNVGGYEALEGLGLPEPIQRVQKRGSGTCFVQAPAIVVNYLVQMGAGEFLGQIDIFKFIRHSFTRDMFYDHIYANRGNSRAALRAMVGHRDTVDSYATNTDNCFQNLYDYGPGLVSRFRIYEDFVTSDKFSYSDSDIPRDEEKPKGSHAMTLIAMRYDAVKKCWWFLLQNTWRDMQYVEVSQKYLVKCIGDARIMFVMDPMKELPSSFRKCKEKYAEACFDGGEDVSLNLKDGLNSWGC